MSSNGGGLLPFSQKVDPSQTALLVIDVQNDFCAPGGYMDREGHPLETVEAMMPRLDALIEGARAAAVMTIYIRASYSSVNNWFLSDVAVDRARRVNVKAGGHIKYPVCMEGEWGFEFYKDVGRDLRPNEITLRKHRYNAFHGTELDLILRSNAIKTVVTTGVSTNVCVESTARDAYFRDFYVVMPADCCASYSEVEQEGTLLNIRRYFGEVVSSEDVLTEWRQGVRNQRFDAGSRAKEVSKT